MNKSLKILLISFSIVVVITIPAILILLNPSVRTQISEKVSTWFSLDTNDKKEAEKVNETREMEIEGSEFPDFTTDFSGTYIYKYVNDTNQYDKKYITIEVSIPATNSYTERFVTGSYTESSYFEVESTGEVVETKKEYLINGVINENNEFEQKLDIVETTDNNRVQPLHREFEYTILVKLTFENNTVTYEEKYLTTRTPIENTYILEKQ